MKIIFCTDGIFPLAVGGMQRHSRLLIEQLALYKDIELHVLHPHKNSKIFKSLPSIIETGIEYKRSGKYIADCYEYSKSIFSYIEKHPDALIYSQGLSVWFMISKLKGRVIVNPHGLEPFQTQTLKDRIITIPFRFVFNHLFEQATHVISLGGRLTKILNKKAGKQKVVTIPNAINLPHKPTRETFNDCIHVLFVGRFAFNKGIKYLIDAIDLLNQEGFEHKFKFTLVGKGPLYESIVGQSSFSNLSFAGAASDEDLKKLYMEADVFILPTLFEGMPTVVLEAMGFALPILVTDTGATCSMVDETNGYIIDKKSAADIKEKLIEFSKLSTEERKKMSDASYDKVKQNFTWDHVAELHVDLFKKMSTSKERV
ncbi:MAG TPA: glycosyltransferase family 4 protein [Bacteroidia bacterium]|nr:glycosyltransferase family 4 protein [Bacteroidia bacterium]HNT79079.1 glycosyltransferase family 4 protein [Bacteroidia bacterium]